MRAFKPKFTIKDPEKFQTDRAKMGNFILEGMDTTGGTDVDWLIEHRGGFIIMENKGFFNDKISIPWGQMIAFEKLYDKLNSDGKCHFLFFGYDDIDFKNRDSVIWYFEMKDWKSKSVPFTRSKEHNKYLVSRNDMKSITLKKYRDLMEEFWKEFEQ